MIVNVRVVQEHLGGNAADVQAGAAQKRIFFDDRYLQSPLSGANRSHISTGTTPNHDKIVFSQSSSP
jgi:hypothetical protein